MRQQGNPPFVNLSLFGEKFFREAIQYHVYEYWTYLQNRLAAIYIGGSVHRNEAVPFPDPSTTDGKISAYLSQLVPWGDWVREQLNAA